jgi:hypothetical protein
MIQSQNVGLFRLLNIRIIQNKSIYVFHRGRRGSDHMVVGFMTTYAISSYHH